MNSVISMEISTQDKIGLRSEKVRNIINIKPPVFIQYGTIVITIVFILLLTIVLCMPYPYGKGENIIKHLFFS